MHDHVQQSFSSSLTHRYYIRHAGNCPVLSVNIESMGDVTSGVAHACGASKANSLCLLFVSAPECRDFVLALVRRRRRCRRPR